MMLERRARALVKARPFLEAALAHDHGLYSMDAVEQDVMRGRAQLWVDDRAAALTFVRNDPNGNVFVLWLAGGELDALIALIESSNMRAFAETEGCKLVEVNGRPGWKKILTKYGFTPAHVTYTMRLSES